MGKKQEAALDQRCEAVERLIPHLVPALIGKWGIFHGDGLYDVCDTMDAAMAKAYRNLPPDAFLLVEFVESPDPVLQHHGIEEDE